MMHRLLFLLSLAPLPTAAAVIFENPLGPGKDTLLSVVCNVSEGLFPLLLIFAIIAFVAAGLFYLYAQGDQQRLSRAKKILYAAVIGTLIAILSFGLPSIIAELFNVPATNLPVSCQ